MTDEAIRIGTVLYQANGDNNAADFDGCSSPDEIVQEYVVIEVDGELLAINARTYGHQIKHATNGTAILYDLYTYKPDKLCRTPEEALLEQAQHDLEFGESCKASHDAIHRLLKRAKP